VAESTLLQHVTGSNHMRYINPTTNAEFLI
jgi:hypothetical protein